MTLQIGRLKLFIISIFLLIIIFFAPNIHMLLIGKKIDCVVYKTSSFNGGENNSKVFFTIPSGKEYKFEVNSNVRGNSTVIYDPNNPENAYLYTFMSFVLGKIIYVLLAAIPATIFVFFFLKKNQYLFIDLKRFKFTKGLKRWTEADEAAFHQLLEESLIYNIQPFEYAFLHHNDSKHTQQIINVTLQQLFIHKHIEITNRLVQVNKTDDKQKPRPFVSLGPNYSGDKTYSSIEKEILSIFENVESLRLHEIRLKLQQKFGAEFEKFHQDVVLPYTESSPLFTHGKPSELGKNVHLQIVTRIAFIEKHLDDLTNEHLVSLSSLLLKMNECWLFIPTETFDKIKSAIIQRKDEIPSDVLYKIGSGFSRISIN